jgi:hypothetical protein
MRRGRNDLDSGVNGFWDSWTDFLTLSYEHSV